MLSLNLNQAFANAKVNDRNTPYKPETKLSFVIVNVYHGITEDEVRERILNNNWRNVTKVSRISNRADGQPTKFLRVITESNNQVNEHKNRASRYIGRYTSVKQAENHYL